MNENQNNREKLVKKMKSWQAEQTKAYRSYIKTSAVGLEFGLAIGLATLIGYFVDKYFDSSPYGLIIGMVIGTIAGAKRLWTFVKAYLAKQGSDDDE